MTRVCMIGFGEAANAMAAGFAEEPAASVAVFDVKFSDAARERAKALGVAAHDDLAAALADAEVVLSLVTGSAAEPVGRQVAPHLRAGQIFVDLNSISPAGKVRVGEAVATGAGSFVEGAVMARVPPYRHKVPILLAGAAAADAAARLGEIGMNCEVVGDRIGQACAVKMIRSVVVKGIEALLIESLTAAERSGVTERILDSLGETFPGVDWRKTATYHLGRTRQHGKRRVTEMKEAAATITGMGLDPVLSVAIARTIEDAHQKLEAGNAPPADDKTDYHGFLEVLARK